MIKFEFEAVCNSVPTGRHTFLQQGNTYVVTTTDFETYIIRDDIGANFATFDYKKFIIRFSPVDFIQSPIITRFISHYTRDKIYREVWKEYVKIDIINLMKSEQEFQQFNVNDLTKEQMNNIADMAAENYVCGHYDCNIDYWSQLRQAISEAEEIERYN